MTARSRRCLVTHVTSVVRMSTSWALVARSSASSATNRLGGGLVGKRVGGMGCGAGSEVECGWVGGCYRVLRRGRREWVVGNGFPAGVDLGYRQGKTEWATGGPGEAPGTAAAGGVGPTTPAVGAGATAAAGTAVAVAGAVEAAAAGAGAPAAALNPGAAAGSVGPGVGPGPASGSATAGSAGAAAGGAGPGVGPGPASGAAGDEGRPPSWGSRDASYSARQVGEPGRVSRGGCATAAGAGSISTSGGGCATAAGAGSISTSGGAVRVGGSTGWVATYRATISWVTSCCATSWC